MHSVRNKNIRKIFSAFALVLFFGIVVSKEYYHLFVPHDDSEFTSTANPYNPEIKNECFFCSYTFSTTEEPLGSPLTSNSFSYRNIYYSVQKVFICEESAYCNYLRGPPEWLFFA